MNFKFTKETLIPHMLKDTLSDINAGGYVSFEGRVRKINNNQEVTHLRYEAYETLAYKEITKILNKTKTKFSIINVIIRHRIGIVKLGEISIWIGVCSIHRKNSFLACEYIIDNFKKNVPIWKEEFYRDKTSTWITCQHDQE